MVEIVSIVANSLDAEFIRYTIEYDNYDIKQKYGDEEIIDHIINNYSKLPKCDEYIMALIDCGFNYKNYRDKCGNSLLMKYAYKKNYRMVEHILKNIDTEHFTSYLWYGNKYDKNIFDVLFKNNNDFFRKLIDIIMRKKCYDHLVDISIKYSLYDILLEVVKRGYYYKIFYNGEKIADTLLTYILRNTTIDQAQEIALEIIKHCPISYINLKINVQYMPKCLTVSPIAVAIMYDHFNVVAALLNAGTDIETPFRDYTIFDFLAFNNGKHSDKMLDLIINKLNETNTTARYEKHIEGCFQNACLTPSNKILIKHIIDNYPNIFNNIRGNIIHYLAIKGYIDDDVLKILLEGKISIDSINEKGDTPIITAIKHIHKNEGKISHKSVYILDILLEQNTLLCKTDKSGNSVLSFFECIGINCESNTNNNNKCNKCVKYYLKIKEMMNSERNIWRILPMPIYEEITHNIENYEMQ